MGSTCFTSPTCCDCSSYITGNTECSGSGFTGTCVCSSGSMQTGDLECTVSKLSLLTLIHHWSPSPPDCMHILCAQVAQGTLGTLNMYLVSSDPTPFPSCPPHLFSTWDLILHIFQLLAPLACLCWYCNQYSKLPYLSIHMKSRPYPQFWRATKNSIYNMKMINFIVTSFDKSGCISLNNGPIWKIKKVAYSGDKANTAGWTRP